MRRSKSVGFSAICLGIALVIGAALLPVSPATQRFGPFQVHVRGDNCGPAGYVAFRDTNSVCRASAHRRLMVTTGVGLLVLALGMALFAGGDDRRRSMVDVGSPVARRRSARRGPGGHRGARQSPSRRPRVRETDTALIDYKMGHERSRGS